MLALAITQNPGVNKLDEADGLLTRMKSQVQINEFHKPIYGFQEIK